MTKHVSPRLRAPLKILTAGAVLGAATVAVRGWATVPVLILAATVLVAAVGYYVWGGRDGDMASVIRHDTDERQDQRRLRAQALVGRVMTLAAAIAYALAVALHAPLWPFAAALALPLLTHAAAWRAYA